VASIAPEIGRLTALTDLRVRRRFTSPRHGLTSFVCQFVSNWLTAVPREIGQLRALERLSVSCGRSSSLRPVSPLAAVERQRADVGAVGAWAALVAQNALGSLTLATDRRI